jgi:hypothetical protein
MVDRDRTYPIHNMHRLLPSFLFFLMYGCVMSKQTTTIYYSHLNTKKKQNERTIICNSMIILERK